MPRNTKALTFTPGIGYAELVRSAKADLAQLENLIRNQTVSVMWKLGKSTHEHLLKNKDKVGYGRSFFENFAKDIGRDISSIQRSVKFYLIYPSIPASWQELSWSHCRALITVKDKSERKKLEEQIIQKKWDVEKLQDYLNFKKAQLAAKEEPEKPITQLEFTHGLLWTYGLVKSQGNLLIDLGFKIRRECRGVSQYAPTLQEGDCIEVVNQDKDYSIKKISISKDELFTYKAKIEKIIDGDTLTVLIDLGFSLSIQQKLRLRGIDCPEMDTEEGKKAKRFVESRLKDCDFIVIKTYKDSFDKYDRYLADIFYLKEENDPFKVAQEGLFLNQELLDKGLATLWRTNP